MEASQLRAIGVLAAILLALTAVLAFWEPEAEPDDGEATAHVVDATDPTQAISARIEQASGERTDTIVLQKTEGIWRVTEPFQADADVERVIAVLDAVRESKNGIPVAGSPEAFGLAPPQVVVVVGMEDGSSRRLELGNVAPVGWRTYARAADGSIAAVGGKPGEELLRRPQEYRDHRIFRYDPGQVTRVSIDSALGLLEARKTEQGWFLTGFGRVDLVELDAWVTDLLDLRVEMFLDLEHDTIADPRFLVQVETPEGTQEMRVGRDTPYGPLVFWAGSLDGVVDPNLLRMLERGPTDVGASQAFPFRPDEITAIELSGAVTARLERPEDGWGDLPVPTALTNAQFVYRREPPAWTAPELTVTLQGGSPAVIDVGPADAEGFRAVKDRAGGEAMRVPVDEVSALFVP